MGKPLVILGVGDFAQLAHFYFKEDKKFEVVAFTVDAAYLQVSSLFGLPVVLSEEILKRYPPDQSDVLVALGYSKLNMVRKERYLLAKSIGYRLASYWLRGI